MSYSKKGEKVCNNCGDYQLTQLCIKHTSIIVPIAILGLALGLSYGIGDSVKVENIQPINEIAELNKCPVQKTKKKKKVTLMEELEPVCGCESSYEGTRWGEPRQFDPDGTVRRGRKNSNDIGMCQINTTYHLETAQEKGYDIYTRQGNIKYANHLYRTQGYQPWSWSNDCHGKLSTD